MPRSPPPLEVLSDPGTLDHPSVTAGGEVRPMVVTPMPLFFSAPLAITPNTVLDVRSTEQLATHTGDATGSLMLSIQRGRTKCVLKVFSQMP